MESFYVGVYEVYNANNYALSYEKSKEGISKFGKSDYLPKFEFIRSMSLGKLKGIDTLEHNLKLLVAKYPKSEVTPRSEDILAAIKKQKTPDVIKPVEPILNKAKQDSFVVNLEGQHFILGVTPDVIKIADGFKTNIGNFNALFYSDKKFDLSSSLLAPANNW